MTLIRNHGQLWSIQQTVEYKMCNLKINKKTFCTRGVVLSFWISATTPLISIPAFSTNGSLKILPNTQNYKTLPQNFKKKLDLKKKKLKLMLNNKKSTFNTWKHYLTGKTEEFYFSSCYLLKRHETSCPQPKHIWPLGPFPIHQEIFCILYPYLHIIIQWQVSIMRDKMIHKVLLQWYQQHIISHPIWNMTSGFNIFPHINSPKTTGQEHKHHHNVKPTKPKGNQTSDMVKGKLSFMEWNIFNQETTHWRNEDDLDESDEAKSQFIHEKLKVHQHRIGKSFKMVWTCARKAQQEAMLLSWRCHKDEEVKKEHGQCSKKRHDYPPNWRATWVRNYVACFTWD